MILPQAWITPAILAAAVHFGPVAADHVRVEYRNLRPGAVGTVALPNRIVIDRRPASFWTKERAQCVLIHEYGHLERRAEGDPRWFRHSRRPGSIMYRSLRYGPCVRWLRRHGVS